MTQTPLPLQETFASLPPFNRLPEEALTPLLQAAQPLKYRIGQPLMRREILSQQVIVILEGQVRILAYDPREDHPLTLQRLGRGELVGVLSLIRGVPCETAIASTEVLALTLPAYTFLQYLQDYPEFGHGIRDHTYLLEAFDLLSQRVKDQAQDVGNLRQKAQLVCDDAAIVHLPPGVSDLSRLETERTWMVSGGTVINLPVGSLLDVSNEHRTVEVISPQGGRLIGLSSEVIAQTFEAAPPPPSPPSASDPVLDVEAIPYASDPVPESRFEEGSSRRQYPFARGRGEIDSTLACFDMVSQHFNMPFRKDVLRRIIANQHQRMGQLSLPVCGAVGEMMGLRTQMVKVPFSAVKRLPTPAIIRWHEGFAVLYETSDKGVVIGDPETGVIRRTLDSFQDAWGEGGEVLLLEMTKETPQQKFGLSWFLPSLRQYRWVLT
ncbi:type I secretion system permease/ATPase, partial [filamentous cyanobacterium CCP5]